jgi:5-methyltetrahydropteroyltriglutamate--homocysteine methyltransferase
MREEYLAVVEAGLLLQIDDPDVADGYQMHPEMDYAAYRKHASLRIEALNHGLRGIPEDRVRYHLCWGSWPGPHTSDVPLRDIVDLLLRVKAQAYSIEAANPRHEWEWVVWQDTKLPEGKILIPGVVTHATDVVEHPELVSQRIRRYARRVGRDNVVAGADCGFGGRSHPQIAWAKLQSLVEGARLASASLW